MDEKSQGEAEMYQDVGGGSHGDSDETSRHRAEASSISTAKPKYDKLKTEQFLPVVTCSTIVRKI